MFPSASVFGFSGSRRSVPLGAVRAALAAIPAGASVFVGCAAGVDACVRSLAAGSRVFRASSFGSGRGAFARRSIACVRAVAAARGVWVSFPGAPCPAGLVPSASPGRCFCGLGSGSWASLALAVGLGVPSFLFPPVGLVPPAGWGFVAVPGSPGWWSAASVARQLRLF